MKSSRLLTTGSVITSSRPESGGRKTQLYWIQTYIIPLTKLIQLWPRGNRDKLAQVFELTNKIMSTVLRTPIVTSTSAEVNVMLRNSIKPIKCGPLRRGHNVQFSSEMTLPGVKIHQQLQANLSLTNDLSCVVLWPLYSSLVTSILINPVPAARTNCR